MPDRADDLDAVFTALAEPTRRAVLARLGERDATVTELSAPFAISLQAFLKHVRVLEDAGMIRRVRIGRTSHVSLIPGPLHAAAGWLEAQASRPVAPPAAEAEDGREALVARARALEERLAPRMRLVRRALEDEPPAGTFAPDDAIVRALRAVPGRGADLARARGLYEAFGEALEAAEAGGDLDPLRELILPLGQLLLTLRPLLAGGGRHAGRAC